MFDIVAIGMAVCRYLATVCDRTDVQLPRLGGKTQKWFALAIPVKWHVEVHAGAHWTLIGHSLDTHWTLIGHYIGH